MAISGVCGATAVYFLVRIFEGGLARVSFGVPFVLGLAACAVYFSRISWLSLVDPLRPHPKLPDLVAGGVAAALGIVADAVLPPGVSAWVWLAVFALFFAFEFLLERWLAAGVTQLAR
jgi:hypothetical protein